MRVKEGYELVEIADEWVLITSQSNAESNNRILTLSESGVLLWNALKVDKSRDELHALMTENYITDDETVTNDLDAFIISLRSYGLLVE